MVASADWAQNIAVILPAISPLLTVAGGLVGVLIGFRLNARKSDDAWVLTKGYETFISYKEAVIKFMDETVTFDNQIGEAHAGKPISTTEGTLTVLKAYRDAKHLGETLVFLFRDAHIEDTVEHISKTSIDMDAWMSSYVVHHTVQESWDEPRDPHEWFQHVQEPSDDIRDTLASLEEYIQDAYYPRPLRRKKRARKAS